MIVPDPYEHWPPGWVLYEQHRDKVYRTKQFTSQAEVNRFATRYRVASAFQTLLLAGFGAATQRGYDSLTRCSLFYTAFEKFLDATNEHAHKLVDLGDRAACLADIRSADPTLRFLKFVAKFQTKRGDIHQWQQFLAGGASSPITLAAGVRHAFFHGHLSPSANGGEAAAASAICERLGVSLRLAMDRGFIARVNELEKA